MSGPFPDNQTSGDLIADRRFGYGQGLLADKDYAAAADLFAQALERVPQWSPGWFALGDAQELSGDTNAAILSFHKALSLAPEDTLGAGLRLSRLGADTAKNAMTAEYVAALFDQYADRFDDHLVKALDYRGPEIIETAIAQYCSQISREFHFDAALDMGCGTGLMARQIGRHVDAMHGIDISPLMVKKALASGMYHPDHLHAGDIVAYLRGLNGQTFDLLMAADVLVYCGELAPLFDGAFEALSADGLFAFTVQSCEGDGFMLGSDLRYHHSEQYLRETATRAGFQIRSLAPCITRYDAGEPVAGLVVVMDRHDANHAV